jgi:hypothetical protein
MTLTIQIPPEVEAAITAKAERLGMPVEHYAAGVLQRDAQSSTDATVRIPVRARGLLAGAQGSVDEFLRERHEEAEREIQKDAA